MVSPTTLPETPEVRVQPGTRRWLWRQLFPTQAAAMAKPEQLTGETELAIARLDTYKPGGLDPWSNTTSAFILHQARVAATVVSASEITVRNSDIESLSLNTAGYTKVIISEEKYNLSSVVPGATDTQLFLAPYTDPVLPVPP
jgi:hypothetical protein